MELKHLIQLKAENLVDTLLIVPYGIETEYIGVKN